MTSPLAQIRYAKSKRLCGPTHAVAYRFLVSWNGMSEINLGERCAVLNLATRWHCENLRNQAIDSLENLVTPLEKLRVARAYNVRHWLAPAYAFLSLRSDPLSVAEARQLDAEDVVRIFSAREQIFRHRLPTREEAVTSHFIDVLLGELPLKCTGQTPHPASSAVLCMSTCRDNEAIIFFSATHEAAVQEPSKPHREEVPKDNVDISLFLAREVDAGVALLTSDNARDVVTLLVGTPEMLSGTSEKGRAYKKYGASLVMAAMRRSVLQKDFVPIAGEFAGAILNALKRHWTSYHQPLSQCLQSLDALWGQFAQSGIVPRQDKGRIMPADLTPEAYRTCMENGQAFIAVLADQGFLRDWKWIAHARIIGRQGSLSSSPLPPVHELSASSGTNLTFPLTARQLLGPVSFQPRLPVLTARASHRTYASIPLPSSFSRSGTDERGSVSTIVKYLTSGQPDVAFAWITTHNVVEVYQEYLAHLTDGILKQTYINLISALLRRACEDRDSHVAGLQFLAAVHQEHPQLTEEIKRPIDWVVENWKQFLQRPDMTPSPDEGRIVRRWQSPGMAPHLYKERIGNVRSFILNALGWLPPFDTGWAAKVRSDFA